MMHHDIRSFFTFCFYVILSCMVGWCIATRSRGHRWGTRAAAAAAAVAAAVVVAVAVAVKLLLLLLLLSCSQAFESILG